MGIRTISFWQRWLLHSMIVLLILNLTDIVIHIYHTWFLGITVRGSSLRDRLLGLNIYQLTPLVIFSVLLIVEWNNSFVYKKKPWIFIAGCLCTGLAGTGILLLINRLLHGALWIMPPPAVPFWFISAYAFVYPLLLEFVGKRVFKAELLYEQSKAELDALKAQTHPHFLFNTLNSLYGTALAEQAPRTAYGIEKLANLMRYILNETAEDTVPAQKEINFLEEYIDLQRMRLPEDINRQVTTTIRCNEPASLIAPLLLLPFVENAFRYGLSINHPCYIRLLLVIENSRLNMNIQNSILNTAGGTGTGISNARKRLQLLYPDKHQLDIIQTEQEYQVLLTIQMP